MSEHKRYKAQEMREMAGREKFKCSFVTRTLNGGIILDCTKDVLAMLRQAADAEVELAKAKRPDACPANPTNKMCYFPGEYCCDAVRYLQKENAKLKARLNEVTEYTKRNTWREDDESQGVAVKTCAKIHNFDMRKIAGIASGESETENK